MIQTKQNGRRKVASISESEILRIRDDAVLQNTKRATKFGLDGFLLQMLLTPLSEYILKQLFFLISVNSAALFTEISKKSCHKLLLGSGFNRPTLTNSKLRIFYCLCQSASCPHHKEQTTCSECSYLELDL